MIPVLIPFRIPPGKRLLIPNTLGNTNSWLISSDCLDAKHKRQLSCRVLFHCSRKP